MKLETIEDLFEKHPRIFKLMEDPYYSISSDLPPAWLKTVDSLCGCIQEYIDNINQNNKHLDPVDQVVCEQVKEKFGGLRFYYHGGDKKCDGMVEMTEYLTWNICQNCGSDEDVQTTEGWIFRLCKNCMNERKKQQT